MDDFDLEIKKEFINEALVNLEEAEGSFMELENSSDKKTLLDKIFRLAHNLKGGSRAVGFGDVAEFTHQLENLVQKIQKGGVELNSDVVTVLLRSNDRLVEMLSTLKGDLNAKFDNSDLLGELTRAMDGTSAQAPTAVTAAPASTPASTEPVLAQSTAIAETIVSPEPPPAVPDASAFFSDSVEPTPGADETPAPMPSVTATPPPAAAIPAARTPTAETSTRSSSGSEDEVVRVNMARIDRLNDFVGELIVLQSVIQQQALAVEAPPLQASIRQMIKLSKDIQGLSMGMRMLPVKPLVQKLQRVVRDTAKALEKQVAFEVEGDQIDIDKSVLDRLADPLIHILRNAVDHGLETPDKRQAAGKGPQGFVRLTFGNEGNHLIVEVRDDGKGIDTEILKKKAIEKGILSDTAHTTEKQLLHLIFHAGFSTKAVASEISGRGVGMDVVKTNVEKVGGQVDVFTEIGKGSLFRLQIPLSLAVIEGLVVTSEHNRYVVPLSQVQETVNLSSKAIHADKLGIGSCFDLRGEVVPLISIDEALGSGRTQIEDGDTGLIVQIGEQPVALVVKDILRSQQIVIKPLGNGLIPQRGWVGSCILGDGLPSLILSPTELLESRTIRTVA